MKVSCAMSALYEVEVAIIGFVYVECDQLVILKFLYEYIGKLGKRRIKSK